MSIPTEIELQDWIADGQGNQLNSYFYFTVQRLWEIDLKSVFTFLLVKYVQTLVRIFVKLMLKVIFRNWIIMDSRS